MTGLSFGEILHPFMIYEPIYLYLISPKQFHCMPSGVRISKGSMLFELSAKQDNMFNSMNSRRLK